MRAGAAVLAAALAAGWAAGAASQRAVPALSLPSWPWWGTRVRVGDREFRPDARVTPDTELTLQVWDADQPIPDAAAGWKGVLSEAIAAFQARYPRVKAEVRVLSWMEFQGAVGEALQRGEPPDVLGVPATYRFDERFQVPLEQYLRALLPADVSRAALPGALRLASEGSHVWSVPRWAEWYGWVKRAQSEGRRLWLDAGSALTWRYLAMTVTPAGERPVWRRSRVEAAAAWLASAPLSGGPVRSGVPLRRPDLSLLEPLFSGQADAVGPVSGRLLFRLGWWPYPEPPAPGAAFVAAPGNGTEREWMPGPLLVASGYAVFARAGADSVRLRVAAELALHLARWASRAISGREGVIPLWNPAWDEAKPGRRPASGESESPPWWHGMSFPPGASPLLLAAPGGDGRPGGGRVAPGGQEGTLGPGTPALWGATAWEEVLHEERVVQDAAGRLVGGQLDLADFVRRVAYPDRQNGPGPGSGPVR